MSSPQSNGAMTENNFMPEMSSPQSDGTMTEINFMPETSSPQSSGAMTDSCAMIDMLPKDDLEIHAKNLRFRDRDVKKAFICYQKLVKICDESEKPKYLKLCIDLLCDDVDENGHLYSEEDRSDSLKELKYYCTEFLTYEPNNTEIQELQNATGV